MKALKTCTHFKIWCVVEHRMNRKRVANFNEKFLELGSKRSANSITEDDIHHVFCIGLVNLINDIARN